MPFPVSVRPDVPVQVVSPVEGHVLTFAADEEISVTVARIPGEPVAVLLDDDEAIVIDGQGLKLVSPLVAHD